MTIDRLLDAVGGADDTLLALCEHIPPKKHTAWKWVSVAACIALTVLAVTVVLRGTHLPTQPEDTTAALPAAVSESETETLTEPENEEQTKSSEAEIPAPPIVNLPAQSEPAFFPNESTTAPYMGSGRVYDGSVETPRNGGETTPDGLWDNAPITSKYPTMVWNGQTYLSRGKAVLDGQVQRQPLGTATLQGFDGDPSHTTTAKLYPINGISTDAAVAVRYAGGETCFPFVCKTYAPGTLGQLTDDLSLWDNITITGASGCGGELAATVYTAPDTDEVRKLLDRDAPIAADNRPRYAAVLIRYSLPLLGQTTGSMGLTEDGDLIVHFCENELTYHVGKARAQAFIDDLNQNCHPTKLAEQTTKGYTVPPAEE